MCFKSLSVRDCIWVQRMKSGLGWVRTRVGLSGIAIQISVRAWELTALDSKTFNEFY